MTAELGTEDTEETRDTGVLPSAILYPLKVIRMIYWLIISIVVLEMIYELTLSRLNISASKHEVPAVLRGLYDDEAYARQQSYFRANRRVGLVSTLVATLFTLLVFALGGLGWLDSLVRSLTDSPVLQALAFFAVLGTASWLISLPIDIYDTFVIEERYGFNKTTLRLYIADTLKSLGLTILLGGGLLALVVWIYGMWPQWFWLIAWGVTALISTVLQYFYSVLLVPIFNKQTPLPEGELRDAIERFAQSVDFRLKNIYVIDGSKRSTHSNAYFTGFGRQKRVVLYDTLIEQLTTDEIVGVLAHEIGHYKHHHIVFSMVEGLATSLVTFILLGLCLDSHELAAAAGSQMPTFHVNVVIFSLLYTPLNILLGIVTNMRSRHNERQADHYALAHGVGPAEASALKKMSAKSLANLTPHPAVVFTSYSHPTLAERVTTLSAATPDARQ